MDKFYNQKLKINKAQNLNRLDQALVELSKKFTRSQIKSFIKNHNITKNGIIIKNASHKVKQNEEYILNIPTSSKSKFEPEDIPLDIIYEDDEIIVINKKAGMVTHPAPGNHTGTLVHALLNHSKNKLSNLNNNRPGIVHRLDKETSGLMVIAKNNETHLHLANQFKNHSISRKYKALVWGVPKNQLIEGYIERHRINRKKMSLNKNSKGKYSKTTIKLKKSYVISSLVECILQTGRTHQVRLHMTSINCPIVGDNVYGKNKINQFSKNKENYNKFLILKNFERQALHAYNLGFNHPKLNKYIEFNSELPSDMEKMIDLLVKY